MNTRWRGAVCLPECLVSEINDQISIKLGYCRYVITVSNYQAKISRVGTRIDEKHSLIYIKFKCDKKFLHKGSHYTYYYAV
jgi:hypothetical protein